MNASSPKENEPVTVLPAKILLSSSLLCFFNPPASNIADVTTDNPGFPFGIDNIPVPTRAPISIESFEKSVCLIFNLTLLLKRIWVTPKASSLNFSIIFPGLPKLL